MELGKVLTLRKMCNFNSEFITEVKDGFKLLDSVRLRDVFCPHEGLRILEII